MLLEHKLQKFFIENKLTLALAESCTGGMIASRLVQIPDSSLYFLGGVVSYSNQSKEHILHVKNQTLVRFGAVSEQTAEEMAAGAQGSFGSDFALATTGIAGPSGGSLEKPVGTVCFSIQAKQNKIFSWTARFEGERSEVINRASQEALLKLWDILHT